jgi:tryptophan halogenase
MHKIQNYDKNVIRDYNKSFNAIVDNIRDFIVLHYLTKRNDTDFWKNISKLEIPESLQYNLEKWKTKIPTSEDFTIYPSTFLMFRESNFIMVMAGLNLFNRKAILQEYNFLSDYLKNHTSDFIIKYLNEEKQLKNINHKEILKIIREIN